MAESERKGAFQRVAETAAASRPGSWFFVHVAPRIDRQLLKLTDGKVTTAGFDRVGFLKVRGAKSGKERITPLVFTRDGENVLLVASRGGDVKHPAWYLNVAANPDVRFSIAGDDRAYLAHTAGDEERERLWPRVVRRYSGYAVYQRRAGDRRIPVIVLEPDG
jgi:deazaflavin-dependent oxidoreductase (nitroreductase family)